MRDKPEKTEATFSTAIEEGIFSDSSIASDIVMLTYILHESATDIRHGLRGINSIRTAVLQIYSTLAWSNGSWR